MKHQNIIDTVQQNCHIADARFAGEYTLCIYLLKMREYFRWEKKFQYSDALPNAEIGAWLTEREQQWLELDETDYLDLTIDGVRYSPYDSVAINKALEPYNLVYSGGIGQQGRPHFFLAELSQHETVDDYHIFVADKELARDLTAPPAMSLNKNIFIRRESLRRMIWERVEEWRWRKVEGAMSRALKYYDFDSDLEQALDQMTDHETEVLLQHEIGEIQAGRLLGEDWHDMLASLPRSVGEIMARAIRDHAADCSTTLPRLLQQQQYASLHFYFGNFNAMRKELFPALRHAYLAWQDTGDMDILHHTVEQGKKHWLQMAQEIVCIFKQHGDASHPHIVKLVETNKL